MTLAPADPAFLQRLETRLPPGTLRPVEPRYLEEPRGLLRGRGGAVALPRSTEEVATILAAAHQARVGVIPYGGGTGLVGGQVLGEGPLPLILCLDRMNRLRGAFAEENVLVAEAGMTVAAVQDAAAAIGRLFPLSLASEGTARLGGVMATNAGGLNVLRYGNTRDLVLGVEAVLADGRILHGLKRLRKDNTGYDLRHLLIGSEGTLGILTAASLRLFPRPVSRATALIELPGPSAALDLLALAQSRLPGMIDAFELISRTGIDFLHEAGFAATVPFDFRTGWLVLIEIGLPPDLGPAEDHLAALYAQASEGGLCGDGTLAQSGPERDRLWRLREEIPLANRRIGALASHDISLPLSAVSAFLPQAGAAIAALHPQLRVNAFGHLGDGNLHYNVFPPPGQRRQALDPALKAGVTETLHQLVLSHGGSISAEHGIGRFKAAELQRLGDPVQLAAMRTIKTALDPHGILNPGAVLGAALIG